MEGSGGTGKSFVYKTLIYRARESRNAQARHILASASTGIAASLLPGATTNHSAYRLPLNKEQQIPSVSWQSIHGRRIRAAHILIIDEISMVETRIICQIDKICRDLAESPALKSFPFGGKVVLMGGDWKQLLPILPGKSIAQQASASFRNSELYKEFVVLRLTQNIRLIAGQEQYRHFVERVGHGENFEAGTDRLSIPSFIRTVHEIKDLIESVYDNQVFLSPIKMAQNAILSSTNARVKKFNSIVLERLSGEERTYFGYDTPCQSDPLDNIYDADRQTENLHAIDTGSMPHYELKLKVGSVVMLLQNLMVKDGLCNGTRMVVDAMGDNLIWVRIIGMDGCLLHDRFALSRTAFEYDDSDTHKTGLKFRRTQFPIKLCFAMTIAKSQGQTFNGKLGLDLYSDIFSPGMLYVALTRVRNGEGVTILTRKPPAGQLSTVKNIVWRWEQITIIENEPEQEPILEVDDDGASDTESLWGQINEPTSPTDNREHQIGGAVEIECADMSEYADEHTDFVEADEESRLSVYGHPAPTDEPFSFW